MRAKDKRTATENVGCSCFIVQEKNSEKPQRGVATTPSPHPLVRPRVNFFPSSNASASVYSPQSRTMRGRLQVFGVMISGISSVIGFL